MLKPTESPPPSFTPRLAASITPGPPPVITAQPASPNRRPDLAGVAIGLGVLAHARGAEDRDRGPVDLVHGCEARPELPGDRENVLGERALVGREESLVVGQRSRSGST